MSPRPSHRALERSALGMEIDAGELEHVVRRRADRARAGEHVEIPVRRKLALRVVSECEMRLHPWRESDGRVLHAERPPDARVLQLLVRLSGRACERVPQQTDTELEYSNSMPGSRESWWLVRYSYICGAP